MFKGKPTKVIITGEAKEEFDDLNKIVGEEISNGIRSIDYQAHVFCSYCVIVVSCSSF